MKMALRVQLVRLTNMAINSTRGTMVHEAVAWKTGGDGQTWLAPQTNPSKAKPIYTCPMHSEVQVDHPGECPKCGMTLELKTGTAGADVEENLELRDMTRRFWVGAALVLPVFGLAMAHLIPVLGRGAWVGGDASRWAQFAFATLVVGWAGWPLLQRGWRSVATGHLNMFTLISIGVGAAFVFRVAAMLVPGIFPRTMQHEGRVAIYFESA